MAETQENIGWHATSSTGVVAAGSAESVAAGIKILENGGNAADAAVATIFALVVTDHGACSIGGEVPLLIFEAKTQKVKSLSGQGGAPLSKDAIKWYMKNGIPGGSDIKMAPVPSVVDLCTTTLQKFGTKTLREVITPTLDLLEKGKEIWHPKLAKTFRRLIEEETISTGNREEKLQAACDRFYGRNKFRNDIAEELEADYIEKGGFLRISDLAAHRTKIEEPVSINYKGYTIYKCGPWTQGPFLLQTMRLLEQFDLKAMGLLSADTIHVMAEAIKLAMADRDEYYGDPEFVEVPLKILLSDAYTKMRQPLIDLKKASIEARPGDPYNMQPLATPSVFRPGIGGTTTCVVAYRWGNVVSATPSANVPLEPRDGGKTGVTFSNRLLSLNTNPAHPNCIQAGKRPRITLTPTLVVKDDKPVIAISVAGADMQDQVTLGLLLDAIEFNMRPEAAVTTPRFVSTHHQNSFDPNPIRQQTIKTMGHLNINKDLKESVLKELENRGHKLNLTETAIAAPVMVLIDQKTGVFYAAGDPKANRHAAGLHK
jgi:gamma-glutamyltranspeptidase/glutathione hydrolase